METEVVQDGYQEWIDFLKRIANAVEGKAYA